MSRQHFKIGKGVSLSPVTIRPTDPENGDIIYNNTNNQFERYENGVWGAFGSGSGGSTNLISNGSADSAPASIFIPYADLAATRPVDGVGGVPTVTTSISTLNPLIGTSSFLLTKPASNTQGQGWAVPLPVDAAYKAKSLKISMDYLVNSGTFVAGNNSSSPSDGDAIIYIYDVTNSTLIEPSNIKFFSSDSTLSDKIEATFQTSSTGSSYRLIVHCASTSALAYALKVDNVSVSPQVYVYGSPVTDWTPVTVTGSFTTNTNYTAFRARVGDSYKYNIRVGFTGAPNATTCTINLPSGDVINTAKLASGAGVNFDSSIEGNVSIGIASAYIGKVLLNSSTSVVISYYDINANGAFVTNTAPAAFANGSFIQVEFVVPIVGLSSSVQMSDTADTRVVAFRIAQAVAPALSTTPVRIPYTATPTYDTHGGFLASDNSYNVKVGGFYDFSFGIAGSSTQVAYMIATIYVNGVDITKNLVNLNTLTSTVFYPSTSKKIELKAGDKVQVYTYVTNGTGVLATDAEANYWSLNLIQGPQAIAASESVNAKYNATTFSGATGIIILTSKNFDSHNAYNTSTGVYTFPTSGTYNISGFLQSGATSFAVGGVFEIYASINGSGGGTPALILGGSRSETTQAVNRYASGSTLVQVKAGDTLSLYQSASTSTTPVAATLSVTKVGL